MCHLRCVKYMGKITAVVFVVVVVVKMSALFFASNSGSYSR